MRVTLERETWERRRVDGRRQSVRVWVRAWRAEVLYADGSYILTRSAGAHQTFRGVPSAARLRKPHPGTWNPDGGIEADMWGYDPKHPAVTRLAGLQRIGEGRASLGRIRISPKSARALRAAVDAHGHGFITRGVVDPSATIRRYANRVQREIAARSGKRKGCKSNLSPKRPRRA